MILANICQAFLQTAWQETFEELDGIYEDSLPHFRGIMRNGRKAFVWRLSRETMAISINWGEN